MTKIAEPTRRTTEIRALLDEDMMEEIKEREERDKAALQRAARRINRNSDT